MRRSRALTVVPVLACLLGLAPGALAAQAPAPTPTPVGPYSRYVDVSVATAWVAAGDNRPGLDDAAVSNPAYPRQWLSGQTVKQKLGLDPLLETQALYGTKVTVDQQVVVNGLLWDHVWVDGQPTPRDLKGYGGYPGWVPDRQLTSDAPPVTRQTLRITGGVGSTGWSGAGGATAWAYDTAAQALARGESGRLVELSFHTTLAVKAVGNGWVQALDEHGGALYLNARDVRVGALPAASGAAIVAQARQFLGLQYLWAGASGFGYDCSGFTHEMYASYGIEIPRDTDAQADAAGDPAYTGPSQVGSASGRWVANMSDLRLGDLVFFAGNSGYIHHVGIFSGVRDGHPMMIDALQTGSPVEEVAIDSGTWAKEFVGGGRYLTS